MFVLVRSATTYVWPLLLLYSHHHHYVNSLLPRQSKHTLFRQYSSLSPIDLNENIKWTSYIAPKSKAIIKIAEVVDIDLIMDYTIENDLPEPFGIVTWESSYTIANLLDTEYHNSTIASLRGKTVCDVGCGTGLASLLCLTYGANVIALDFNQYSLQLGRISYNRYRSENYAEVDEIENSIDFRYYDLLSSKELPHCELLLISDVTYYDSLAVIVAARIHEAVVSHNCAVLITDPGRSTHQLLIQELHGRFMDTHVIVPSRFLEYKVADKIKGYYLWINAP